MHCQSGIGQIIGPQPLLRAVDRKIVLSGVDHLLEAIVEGGSRGADGVGYHVVQVSDSILLQPHKLLIRGGLLL